MTVSRSPMRTLALAITSALLWIDRHPRSAVMLALALLLPLLPGLGRLGVDTTSESLLVPDDPGVAQYQEAREIFGEDVILTLVLRAPDVFTPEVLEAVGRMTLDGEVLDGVTRVVSLTTASNLRGREGVLDTSLLISGPTSDAEQLARIREDALSNPVLVGEVVSAAGDTAAIHLFVESRAEDPGYARRLVAEAEELLERERVVLGDGVVLYQIGSPYVKTEILRSIHSDIFRLAPIACVALLGCFLLFFGSSVALLIPVITGLVSIAGTFGFMGWVGYEINPITTILPSLLLVIGSSEDVHMLAEYADEIGAHGRRNIALRRMILRMGAAITMTSTTTFFGFLSLSGHSIPILREFGIAASFGIFFNFVITLLMVPPLLRWWPVPRSFRRNSTGMHRFLGLLRSWILQATFRHRGWTLGLIALVTAAAGWAAQFVVINTSYGEFFREDSELRQRYSDFAERMTGVTYMLVTLDGPEDRSLLEPHFLAEAGRLRDYLQTEAKKVSGHPDFFRKLHQEMNAGRAEADRLPEDADLIAQYALMLPPDDLSRFLSFDHTRACFLLRGDFHGSREINAAADRIRAFAVEHIDPTLVVDVNGESVLVARASDTMSMEILSNLLLLAGAIFVVISIFFRSLWMGVLVMIPNIVPVVLNFGLMGLCGIPLSTATFPVAIIALGIIVDDTIHLMARYARELRTGIDKVTAVRRTLTHEIRPVLTTSVAHICGFSVFLLGEFESVQQFGLLASFAMLSAIIADLFLTPAILTLAPRLKT